MTQGLLIVQFSQDLAFLRFRAACEAAKSPPGTPTSPGAFRSPPPKLLETPPGLVTITVYSRIAEIRQNQRQRSR